VANIRKLIEAKQAAGGQLQRVERFRDAADRSTLESPGSIRRLSKRAHTSEAKAHLTGLGRLARISQRWVGAA